MEYEFDLSDMEIREQLHNIHIMIVDLDKRLRVIEPLVYEQNC